MHYFGIVSEVLAQLPHLPCWLHAVHVASVSKHFGEGGRSTAQSRAEVDEGLGRVPFEHLLYFSQSSYCSRVCPRDAVEQIGDDYVLGVFDLRFDGFSIGLSFLLVVLKDLLLAGEVDLFDSSVEGEFVL
jgi:hypothetical protein